MAVDDDDWRLDGQEQELQGVTLFDRVYHAPRPDWDHDHCAFCWAKFMEGSYPETLQRGWTTADEYHWVCPPCFEDFRERFQWVSGKGPAT